MIGSCEKGLDKRIDAQSRCRANGGGGEGGRERKERYESGDFLREYNTGVGQRGVIIIERIMRLISITGAKDRGNRFVKCLRDHARNQHKTTYVINITCLRSLTRKKIETFFHLNRAK